MSQQQQLSEREANERAKQNKVRFSYKISFWHLFLSKHIFDKTSIAHIEIIWKALILTEKNQISPEPHNNRKRDKPSWKLSNQMNLYTKFDVYLW